MNTEEAIDFLKSHQPLPEGKRANNHLFSKLNEVRKHFESFPDDRSVPLLLGALGPGDGHGIYVMIEETLHAHSPEVVSAELKNGLKSQYASVRYWSAQFAAGYPNEDMKTELISAFINGDSDTQIAAITAIEAIGTPVVKKMLQDVREKSVDQDVIDLLDEVTS